MGIAISVICKRCGSRYSASFGGGFVFHLLRCDACGREKSIAFHELGDLHLRYLKGLDGPYCVATSEHDRLVRENYPGEPLGEDEYFRAVEEFAGGCGCGGRFRMNAKPRCPECGSAEFDEDPEGPVCCYD